MSTGADMAAARQRIAAAYDPELFQEAGQRLIAQLSAHLRKVQAADGSVLPWRDPAANVAEAASYLAAEPLNPCQREQLADRFAQLVALMLRRGHNLHDPRYIGHQVPASVPLAGLLDAVGSVTNQPMAIYDMGPWATAAEWALVEHLGQQIGWAPQSFAGLVTHGGSLANLTALLAARNVALAGAWEQGLAGRPEPPVLVVHGDAHYSIGRAAGVLGVGTSQVLRVGLDARRRMDPNRLQDLLAQLRARGQDVVAVVACSCSTPIGAFDPLPEIADVCRRHEVWLHVDAAHGGSACLSPRHRDLVAGLDRADSVVWDAHKMLFMPALCAFVFFRDKAHRFEAFRQEAPYLFDPTAPGLAEYDSGLRTVECTKRAAAFGLWGVWSLFGPQLFADLVDVTFALGQQFYEKLLAAPDFEAVHEPQCNIVVFRFVPHELVDATRDAVGRFQLELRRRLIESGEFYIVSTKIDGVGALRATIINPLTTPDHLDHLLAAIRRHGHDLLSGRRS
ncbi:MAG: aminotransferase class I/II-fold pyridoxal phosphate-dependent enzyme [Pirellulaceae bacterium]|jgi:L-2,4-diaminobutyrate decarboxylase|nr:aminotransferase class I/II-fold pyridoxal phosphate-dependent enzyme [Pirellulaceae bacterium]